MNILLTGGAGYIGSHTAVVLTEAGHKVMLLDNLHNSSPRVLDHLSIILGRRLDFVKADVRETDRVFHVLQEYKIDAVIHFAGLKAVGESVKTPIDYYDNNIRGTISLLKAMNQAKVKTLVFSSSATVYGQPQYLPIDEKHHLTATNPYGRSKLHIEEMLMDLPNSDPSWSIACLRYFNPVGAHDSGLIGDSPNDIPNNLMPFVAQVAAGMRAELSIFGNDYETPDGTGVRDYIHVMDLAYGHVAAVKFLQANPGWHAVNLGTGLGYSVLEMINAFEKVSGRSVPYRILARRPGDIAECYCNPSKAKTLLDWTAKRGLNEMCESLWLFQKVGGAL